MLFGSPVPPVPQGIASPTRHGTASPPQNAFELGTSLFICSCNCLLLSTATLVHSYYYAVDSDWQRAAGRFEPFVTGEIPVLHGP